MLPGNLEQLVQLFRLSFRDLQYFGNSVVIESVIGQGGNMAVSFRYVAGVVIVGQF